MRLCFFAFDTIRWPSYFSSPEIPYAEAKGVGAPMSSDEDPWQLSCGKKGAFRNPSKLKKKSISQTQQKLEAITNTIALGFFVSTVQVCFACVRQYKKKVFETLKLRKNKNMLEISQKWLSET